MIPTGPAVCLECGGDAPRDGRRICPACAATWSRRTVADWWEPEPDPPMGMDAVDDGTETVAAWVDDRVIGPAQPSLFG